MIKPNSNPAMVKLSLLQKIKPIYSEYKNFIGNQKLPDFEIVPFSRLKTNNSTEASITFKDKKYILNIEQHVFTIKPKTTKSVLFHEFTHILDETTLLQQLRYEDRKTLLHAYTEYHATQIEMMCACNFKNINDNRRLIDTDIIYDGNVPQNIADYLKFEEIDYLSTVKRYILQNNPHGDLMILIHSIYIHKVKLTFLTNFVI